MQRQFSDNWSKHFQHIGDGTVLLAVSGGIDSMVMASVFLSANISFAVAHCNFQLRAADADADEELVRKWCTDNNIPFHHVRFDTQAKMDEWKKAVQETARILRYDWLESIRAENGYSCIATAHHANDNAETLLMNLFKGTGISGLHGIPTTNNYVIRPLLFANKEDISQYAKHNNIPYRDDVSNASDKYLRNRVRHHLLPIIEESFPNVVSNLNDSIQRFAEAEILYRRAFERERKQLLEQRGNDWYVPIRKLEKRTPLATICYELLLPFGFTSQQVPHILSLLYAESGRFLQSQTHRIVKDRQFLIITKLAINSADLIPVETLPTTIEAGNKTFKFTLTKPPVTITPDESIAYIDVAQIQEPILLRRWRQGDYFYPIGMGMKKKKLSRYLIDMKIPIHQKENIWVLESNKRIVWVAGYRLDERMKITPQTTQALKVTIS